MLEGTYPYVSGGVSACVHQLISNLPTTTFDLVYIGARSGELLRPKYRIPPNVVSISEFYLFDEIEGDEKLKSPLTKQEIDALRLLHKELHRRPSERHPMEPREMKNFCASLDTLFPTHAAGKRLFRSLTSKEVWQVFLEEYQALDAEVSFIEFFYTWRSAHLPIYRILSNPYPKASLYHSLCTGYAGLAGAVAAYHHDSPLFLTEHGIYAHERAIELAEAEWLYRAPRFNLTVGSSADTLKAWWIDMFRNLSRIEYAFCAQIITLYEGNLIRQHQDHAPKARTQIIPNGIGKKFHHLRRSKPSWAGRDSQQKFTIGFVGRIVPIKDVKTLIKSVHLTHQNYNNIECKIIGPHDEDSEYFQSCKDMVKFLQLDGVIEFCGKKNVSQEYPDIDLLLLTSISEGQPLVVLEANGAGIPVVSTNVGSCEELLNGRLAEDRLLGPSGLIAPIGNPEVIAEKIIQIINEPILWEQMSLAGIARVTHFYDEVRLSNRYDSLYRRFRYGLGQVPDVERKVLPWQI